MSTPDATEVLDGFAPARHTAVAPPSSARCRARYGRQASRRERPLPCPPSSASIALYRASRRSPPGGAIADPSPVAQTPDRHDRRCRRLTRTDFACVCLAALQGGQADALPHRSVARLAVHRDAPACKLKFASSPSDSGGSLTSVHSGFSVPSKANEAAFEQAVEAVTAAARLLVAGLVTNAEPRNRDVEAAKAKARTAASTPGPAADRLRPLRGSAPERAGLNPVGESKPSALRSASGLRCAG